MATIGDAEITAAKPLTCEHTVATLDAATQTSMDFDERSCHTKQTSKKNNNIIQQATPTPAALYARVPSDRQDVDLSIAAQLRGYAEKNGYVVAREYVDEAESGRIADRPQFRKMIDEASRSDSPFQEILTWHNAATPSLSKSRRCDEHQQRQP